MPLAGYRGKRLFHGIVLKPAIEVPIPDMFAELCLDRTRYASRSSVVTRSGITPATAFADQKKYWR
jgi:hypothetical protein